MTIHVHSIPFLTNPGLQSHVGRRTHLLKAVAFLYGALIFFPAKCEKLGDRTLVRLSAG